MTEDSEDSEESARRAAEEWPTQNAPLELPVSATLRAAPAVGERVGKYVIVRTIGHGGMGIVVAARHETLDEMVAIKLLHPKAAKDALQVERFVREARATVRIKSEHVVRVLDAGAEESTGAPFIVMELLEGRDLGFVLSHYGPVSPTTAVDYIIQICEGVGAAHALGIVHRDLKPSNFFLTQRSDGTPLVKVLDFGIPKAAQSDGSPDPRLTETQAVFGSPTYMSPEQIRSSKNVDARSDVWSLGVALFELLTGKLPFMADNVAGLLASVIADPPFAISSFASGIAPGLEAVVLGCLEKDAARRIGSAAELAMRLAPFASADGALLATRVRADRARARRPAEHSAAAAGVAPSSSAVGADGAHGAIVPARAAQLSERACTCGRVREHGDRFVGDRSGGVPRECAARFGAWRGALHRGARAGRRDWRTRLCWRGRSRVARRSELRGELGGSCVGRSAAFRRGSRERKRCAGDRTSACGERSADGRDRADAARQAGHRRASATPVLGRGRSGVGPSAPYVAAGARSVRVADARFAVLSSATFIRGACTFAIRRAVHRPARGDGARCALGSGGSNDRRRGALSPCEGADRAEQVRRGVSASRGELPPRAGARDALEPRALPRARRQDRDGVGRIPRGRAAGTRVAVAKRVARAAGSRPRRQASAAPVEAQDRRSRGLAYPGLVIKVDGEPKGEALWSGIPVDPGTRTLEALATNKNPLVMKVKVDDEGVLVVVTVPVLADAPVATPAAAPAGGADYEAVEQYAANRARRTTGFVIGAIGLGTLAVGAAFGVAAIINDSDAKKCSPCVRGSAEASASDQSTDRAFVFANISNVTVPLGAVGSIVGAYLVLSAGPSQRVALVPVTSAHSGGLSMSGQW